MSYITRLSYNENTIAMKNRYLSILEEADNTVYVHEMDESTISDKTFFNTVLEPILLEGRDIVLLYNTDYQSFVESRSTLLEITPFKGMNDIHTMVTIDIRFDVSSSSDLNHGLSILEKCGKDFIVNPKSSMHSDQMILFPNIPKKVVLEASEESPKEEMFIYSILYTVSNGESTLISNPYLYGTSNKEDLIKIISREIIIEDTKFYKYDIDKKTKLLKHLEDPTVPVFDLEKQSVSNQLASLLGYILTNNPLINDEGNRALLTEGVIELSSALHVGVGYDSANAINTLNYDLVMCGAMPIRIVLSLIDESEGVLCMELDYDNKYVKQSINKILSSYITVVPVYDKELKKLSIVNPGLRPDLVPERNK